MGEPNSDNVRHLGSRERVLTEIQEWILRAHLRAGDELPPARVLARSIGVGAVSVREGFRVLESLGVLDVRPDGEAVAAAGPAAGLDTLLRLHMSLSGFGVTELMPIRIELERSSAARAALEAAPEDLGRLHSVVDEMARSAIDHARFGALDCEFHLGLARAAHNELAAVLLASLGDTVKHEMSAGYARRSNWPDTAGRLAAEHDWILTSIESGDPTRAVDVITKHITGFYNLRAG